MSEGWELKRNTLTGNYELRLELQAVIGPKSKPYLDAYITYPQRLYTDELPITVVIPSSYFIQSDPDKLLNQIQRQVQSIWTQAVAGMAGKYTDLILEALAPSIQEILDRKRDINDGNLQ